MRTAMIQTLKYTPVDGSLAIWQRDCRFVGIVGRKK